MDRSIVNGATRLTRSRSLPSLVLPPWHSLLDQLPRLAERHRRGIENGESISRKLESSRLNSIRATGLPESLFSDQINHLS